MPKLLLPSFVYEAFVLNLCFRWLDYAPVGRDIPEIRMVPFKTPLEKGFFDQMRNAEENRFEVNTLIEYVIRLLLCNKPKVVFRLKKQERLLA